ncbi:PA2778 family cysteine peptidase [Halopseudomonas sp.]|uniref:PA2778 family cysteine peptidase n=1 Tax=Halopseudomonas sp. TaxID=2901191 RepID=UPI00356A8395
MTRQIHLIVLLGLTALLSACAGRPVALPPPEALADLSAHRHLEQVPFYAQDAYQCGPAALAMVLNHRGKQTTPEALKDRVYIPERKGTLQVELVAAGRERDLLVYPLAGKLENVMAEVDTGNPVLVMQNLAFNWLPQWHYAVVIGYDLASKEMIVHSGLNKARREPFKVFMRTWDRAERWALVMLPPGQLPATAEPLAYLRAASDLEQTGRLDSAALAYQSAMQQWPDQAAAPFGLGNVAWAQGRKQDAVEHFRTLVSRFPGLQAGWNNLAVSLEATDCPVAAQAARDCLEALDPDSATTTPSSDVSHCPVPACR